MINETYSEWIVVLQILLTGIVLPLVVSGGHVRLVNRIKKSRGWEGWKAKLLNLAFSAAFGFTVWIASVNVLELSLDKPTLAAYIVVWYGASQFEYGRFRRAEIEDAMPPAVEDAKPPAQHPLAPQKTILRK